MLHRAAHRGGRPWRRLGRATVAARSGRLATDPAGESRARSPNRDPTRGPRTVTTARPTLGREPPRGHRQARRPPAPRRPAAGGRLRPRDGSRVVSASTRTSSSCCAGTPARTPWSTSRSTARRPTPVLVHGVQVHPVNRRTLHVDLFAGPDDRGADGRRAARLRRRVARRRRSSAGRSSTRSSRSRSGRCRTTCPSRSRCRSTASSTSRRRSTSAT